MFSITIFDSTGKLVFWETGPKKTVQFGPATGTFTLECKDGFNTICVTSVTMVSDVLTVDYNKSIVPGMELIHIGDGVMVPIFLEDDA